MTVESTQQKAMRQHQLIRVSDLVSVVNNQVQFERYYGVWFDVPQFIVEEVATHKKHEQARIEPPPWYIANE